MLSKRLPVPAYDMLLKCSHAFNVLDARGAVGVTERADCFATMRALAREVTGGCCGYAALNSTGQHSTRTCINLGLQVSTPSARVSTWGGCMATGLCGVPSPAGCLSLPQRCGI